jgi:murein DD-endopeptidase MepM/ murein hydrolase activator NlpD
MLDTRSTRVKPSRKKSSQRLILRIAVPIVLLAIGFGLSAVTQHNEALALSPYPVGQTIPYRTLQELGYYDSRFDSAELHGVPLPIEFEFRSGETLGDVLEDLGFKADDSRAVSQEVGRFADLRKLRPQDRYAGLFDIDSNLRGFELSVAGEGRVSVVRGSEAWESEWLPFTRDIRSQRIKGELQSSLEGSIRQSGGRPLLAYKMSDVFQWDLDFTRDLRVGDRFEVMHEEVYLDGQFYAVGDILALHYWNQGRELQAYKFGEDSAYYDAEGRPLRKLFLRSPLRYSRVTSQFSHRRYHPVLKSYRPHYGVDYGAPKGTPVRVTASGTVLSAGWDGGGGKTVKVRHTGSYMTAYLHLSGFAKGVARGRRVQQGQVIGYVGSTGLATGNHLDYRVQHAGKWINPLSLKSVPAKPIPEDELREFRAWRDSLRESLAGGTQLERKLGLTRVAERAADESDVQGSSGG